MKVSLVVRTPGKWQGKIVAVTRSPFLIGRDPACHLRPASPTVSNRHCAILIDGAHVRIRDLGSTNGTFLGGNRVDGESEISDHAVLKVGPLDFDVRVEATTPVNQPTPVPTPRGSAAKPSEDDHVAALLLSLQEGGDVAVGNASVDGEGVPTGRTSMDLSALARAGAPPVAPVVEWEDIGDAVEVHFTESRILDDEQIKTVGEQLVRLIEESRHRKLVLNLANTQAMSSAMVDQLVAFGNKVRSVKGQLVLCNIQPSVYPLFQHMRLSKQFTIRRDPQEALRAFR